MNTTIRLYANQIDLLRKEIEQLRNQWISVKERLPEEGRDVLIVNWQCITYRIQSVFKGDIRHMKEHPELYKAWMLTPTWQEGGAQ